MSGGAWLPDRLPPPPKLVGRGFYREVLCRIAEETFAVLYSDAYSRPNSPVNVLVCAEILKSGLVLSEETLGILGPAWMVPDLDRSWADAAEREVILNLARLTENEPVLGPRLLGVGRKPKR